LIIFYLILLNEALPFRKVLNIRTLGEILGAVDDHVAVARAAGVVEGWESQLEGDGDGGLEVEDGVAPARGDPDDVAALLYDLEGPRLEARVL